MPNANASFEEKEKWFFDNLPLNHTVDDVIRLLSNLSNSVNGANSGQQSFLNSTRELCKDLFMSITPEEMMQVQNNESDGTIGPKDISFVMECHNKFNYFDVVANLGRVNNTHIKADNDCGIYLGFNALLLGLVILLAIGCFYKNRCARRIGRDSPLLDQGDFVNDSPSSVLTEQQEFLSSNQL